MYTQRSFILNEHFEQVLGRSGMDPAALVYHLGYRDKQEGLKALQEFRFSGRLDPKLESALGGLLGLSPQEYRDLLFIHECQLALQRDNH